MTSEQKVKKDECPMKHLHAASPTGYLEFFYWCQRMLKTHKQKQCSGCGLWVIWEEKPVRRFIQEEKASE